VDFFSSISGGGGCGKSSSTSRYEVVDGVGDGSGGGSGGGGSGGSGVGASCLNSSPNRLMSSNSSIA